jgi:hypothetical protein
MAVDGVPGRRLAAGCAHFRVAERHVVLAIEEVGDRGGARSVDGD